MILATGRVGEDKEIMLVMRVLGDSHCNYGADTKVSNDEQALG